MATAVQKRMRENVEFLRNVSSEIAVGVYSQREWKATQERLLEIADSLEGFSDVMFSPSLRLEQRVEEAICVIAEQWLNDDDAETAEGIIVALWWHARATKTAAGSNLIGGALGALGGAMIGGAMKDPKP